MPVLDPEHDLEATVKLLIFKLNQLERRVAELEKNTPPHLRGRLETR